MLSHVWLFATPMDCSLLGSSVHGILQARILEWGAIPFSRGPSWPRDQTQVSHIAGRFFTVWATHCIPKHMEGKNDKKCYIKKKNFSSLKDIISRKQKGKLQAGEKCLQNIQQLFCIQSMWKSSEKKVWKFIAKSCLTLCAPVDCSPPKAPLSTGFSRQEHWNGLPFPSPRDLPKPGIKPGSPAWQVDSLPLSHQRGPSKALQLNNKKKQPN